MFGSVDGSDLENHAGKISWQPKQLGQVGSQKFGDQHTSIATPESREVEVETEEGAAPCTKSSGGKMKWFLLVYLLGFATPYIARL